MAASIVDVNNALTLLHTAINALSTSAAEDAVNPGLDAVVVAITTATTAANTAAAGVQAATVDEQV